MKTRNILINSGIIISLLSGFFVLQHALLSKNYQT
jgi:hypothetical protein